MIMENKKYANDMIPSMLIHPGEMLKDEIEARGITQKDLAGRMGVSYTVFNEILNGKRPITTEYALLLEVCLRHRCRNMAPSPSRLQYAKSEKRQDLRFSSGAYKKMRSNVVKFIATIHL